MESNTHLLTLITFIPLIGMILVLLTPSRAVRFIKQLALLSTLPSLVLGIYMLSEYDPAGGMQFVERIPWISAFNINYAIGADGLSVPLIFLTVLLCPICILASWGINDRVKGYFALFLLLETGMLGVFISLDFFLFYVFWELMLLPMYFLIGVWGGPRREYAAIKFFLYTLAGSVFLLLAMIVIYLQTNGSFDLMALPELIRTGELGENAGLQWWLFLGMFVAFAIKIPAFPFHTWLPDAHVEAPTAISVILAGILLKMGTYGILRIAFPLLPEMVIDFAFFIAIIAVINIVYGAFCAMAQTDLKKLVAYSSISHMGYVMLGMVAFNEEGLNGAVLQMFNHGTITAMLFLLVGVIYDRAHHRDIEGFGGLTKSMPMFSAITCLAFFAALGLPGLSGFISEAFVFIGAFQTYPVITIVATLGIVLGAAYMLWTYQRVFLGPLNPKYARMPDCSVRELVTLYPLAIIVVALGVYPKVILDLFMPTMKDLLSQIVA